MNRVMVSVICTNYNKGDWISEAIESFLKQETNFEFEILLIDDKSTDGSQDTVKEYAKKYPDKIRAFYNKNNLGITKTWVRVCKEAKGRYIARCDGDDYWVDTKKLQKQVDLLENSSDSDWCSTDCDIISATGEIIQHSAFETGFFSRPTSYAEMLATKGITAPSTWLIKTELLKSINDQLHESAVDDTFNIQLDLFSKTKLSYISEVTAVYRINEGSDSRPIDKAAAKARDRRLLDTQLEYMEKYKNTDYDEIIKVLLHQSMENDERNRESHDRLQLINRQRDHIKSLEWAIKEKDEVIRHKDDSLQYKDDSIRQRDEQISEILSSKKYKIGNIIATPLSKTKSVLKREKNHDK